MSTDWDDELAAARGIEGKLIPPGDPGRLILNRAEREILDAFRLYQAHRESPIRLSPGALMTLMDILKTADPTEPSPIPDTYLIHHRLFAVMATETGDRALINDFLRAINEGVEQQLNTPRGPVKEDDR